MDTCKTLVETARYPATRDGNMVASLSSWAQCGKDATDIDNRGRPACEEHKI